MCVYKEKHRHFLTSDLRHFSPNCWWKCLTIVRVACVISEAGVEFMLSKAKYMIIFSFIMFYSVVKNKSVMFLLWGSASSAP